MKKWIALFLCLCLAAGLVPALAEDAPFTVRTYPLWEDDRQVGTLDLRFYADKPDTAYIGIKAYMAALPEVDLTVTAQEDGTMLLTHPNGSALKADPASGTIYAGNWSVFQTPALPYIGKKEGLKDTDCWWTEIRELVYDQSPAPVTFDFAKYGIAQYADGEDVYLPLAVTAGLLEDTALQLLAFNGDKAFRYSGNMNNMLTFAPGYYEGEKIRALVNGETQRTEDQIRESYAELCFFTDYLYGHPGTAVLDAAIAEKGLDAALDDLPDGRGAQIREALHSPDYCEYLCGINDLICYGLSDGHTSLMSPNFMLTREDLFPGITDRMMERFQSGLIISMGVYQMYIKQFLDAARKQLWGDETYREYGSTAIIRIDSFNPDEAGWAAWKEGKGEIPNDALGITWTGLQKAMANPAVKNILFDLTLNGGGSQDLLQAIVGMFTGDVELRGCNTLTKQDMHTVTVTDRNMDGVIDEKDREVRYDYNLGVLTSRLAFSCGNLFPFMMQKKGAVVIGENTGGGSCVVQMLTLSDGPVYMMSSYMLHLTSEDGADVEKGADPDIPLERTEYPGMVNPYFPRLTPGDYTSYYDDEMLDKLMNEWFAQEEAPAA